MATNPSPPEYSGYAKALSDVQRTPPELLALGRAIRAFRLEIGLSQEALADQAGIDRSYMGGIERGEHNLALINIKKVANALNLSVTELMTSARL